MTLNLQIQQSDHLDYSLSIYYARRIGQTNKDFIDWATVVDINGRINACNNQI